MEGGVGWWNQIVEALEQVEFMVLVMSPAAVTSKMVRKEWRHARQQGVCVYPVKASPDDQLDFAALPRWMSDAHFYDLEHEWGTFVQHLKAPCRALRIPFLAPDLPDRLVHRPGEFDRLLGLVLDASRENPRPGTLAVRGSGGFGKTTLATDLCHHEEIITAFDEGILWTTLGQRPKIQAELTKLYAGLTGERPAFVDEEDAAYNLSEKLAGRRCLIVIDDVWHHGHLQPFLRGGENCVRLVTTRKLDVAMELDERVDIGRMTPDEAVEVLTYRIDPAAVERESFRELAERLRYWPLLLELAGGALRNRLARKDSLARALAHVNKALDKKGVTAFDAHDPVQRKDAVARTVAVSLDLLTADERSHFTELAIFPEDLDVPLAAIEDLTGLDGLDSEDLAQRLDDLSLLHLDLQRGTIRLHDEMRSYLEAGIEDPVALHTRLADRWRDRGDALKNYPWRLVAHHLVEAMQGVAPEVRQPYAEAAVDFLSGETSRASGERPPNDVAALHASLSRVVPCAAENLHPAAPSPLVCAATALDEFERNPFAIPHLFKLGREGKLMAVEDRLELIQTNADWRQTSLLLCAWLSPDAARAQVDALVARIEAEPKLPVNQLLLDRTRTDHIAGTFRTPLPPAPDESEVRLILDRLAGSETSPTGIQPLAVGALRAADDAAPALLAEMDAPLLVAFVLDGPDEGERERRTSFLERYVSIQAANDYDHYRKWSLQSMIPALLEHPDATWIQKLLQQVVEGALRVGTMHFREATGLALAAWRGRRGEGAAAERIRKTREDALNAAAEASPFREGDPWSHLLRRLVALAEIHARILGNGDYAQSQLLAAVALPMGFAGYRSTACMCLAEAGRVCRPADANGPRDAWEAALVAAHNIQDFQFCARATSRANAMRLRWGSDWNGADVIAQTTRLRDEINDPRVCAIHVVGESYDRRAASEARLPIPRSASEARTLVEISDLYRCETGELLRVNVSLCRAPDDSLELGTRVNIPDPGFLPLIAARLAAELISQPGLSDDERRRHIQSLVPAAVGDSTALDTVLMRLLLVSPLDEPEALERVERALNHWV
jgi:hypothetical protein